MRLTLAAVGVSAAAIAAVWAWHRIEHDPKIVFLHPESGAQWIEFDQPFSFVAHRRGWVVTDFRKRFRVDAATAAPLSTPAVLTVRALRLAEVSLDGEPLSEPAVSDLDAWKSPLHFELPTLRAGDHELHVRVMNREGPAAVLAYCESIGLITDADWDSRTGEGDWQPARRVDDVRPTRYSRSFPPSYEALVSRLPFLLAVFVPVFIGSWIVSKSENQYSLLVRYVPTPSRIRWCLLALWALLGLNNVWKMPLGRGFDVVQHAEYVLFIVRNQALPLATDGVQMFQSPLYYTVSAGLFAAFAQVFDVETTWRLVTLVPAASDLAQVEISYRALRYSVPERGDLQSLGLLIGGLLPMNLYMSAYLGNEVPAGCLTATAIVMVMRAFREPSVSRSKRWQCGLGLCFGLALLTKVTPILLLVPIVLSLAYCLRVSGLPTSAFIAGCLRTLAVAATVAGWYYLRNWIELGKPFVGGWEPATGNIWWQDPGYRIIKHFTTFGESLFYPIYAARHGFWDALYSSFWLDGYESSMQGEFRPPWNYQFLLASTWLALLPAAAIALGMGVSLLRPERSIGNGRLFAAVSVAIYLAALLDLYLRLPIFTTAKASYTLGLTPCYAVLAAAGLGPLSRKRALKAIVSGWIVAWATCIYLAYFIV